MQDKLHIVLKNPNIAYAIWQKNEENPYWNWIENNEKFAPILLQYGLGLPLPYWWKELEALEKNENKATFTQLLIAEKFIKIELKMFDNTFLVATYDENQPKQPNNSNIHFFDILDCINAAILEINAQNQFISVSKLSDNSPLNEKWFLNKNIFDVFKLPFANFLSQQLIYCENNLLPLQTEFLADTGEIYAIDIYKINYYHQNCTKVLLIKNISEEKKSAAALRLSLERFETQYQNMPIPTYTWQYHAETDDFVFAAHNQAAFKITNGYITAYLGKNLYDLYHDRPFISQSIRDCFQTQKNIHQSMPYHLRILDQHLYFNISYVFVPPDLVMVHTEDATEKWKVEQELLHQQAQQSKLLADLQQKDKLLSAVAYSTELLLSNDNLIKAIKKGFERICQNVAADFAFLFKNSKDENGVLFSSLVTGWTTTFFSQADKDQWNTVRVDTVPAEIANKLSQGQIFTALVRLLSDSPIKNLLNSNGIKSVLAIPVMVKNKFWGLIGFDDCVQERIWNDSEKSILTAFANSVAAAIEREIYETELIAARNEAIEANKAKSDFLANMSHEIRTPMNGIIGLSNLLAMTSLSTQQQVYLDNMQNSAISLLNIVNDILDFSKIEARKMDLEQIPFNLDELIRHTLKSTSYTQRVKTVL
jgi:PAS domain-containing protein